MFRIAINKLFTWLFSRVLATHRGCKDSIPGRDMSVWGPLLYKLKLNFHFSKDSPKLGTKLAGTTYWDLATISADIWFG
jgi:hypothetical protein